ncbi:DUF309 domain-containing protein [Streptomyces sp. XM4193]|uniref:DUF309 domain-containing protein n=1 Tax=Streptomyces sp. XM4193 TaxID=2929782 RepID=UPI001FFA9CB9|nr:DUF309 domain-containing protein [Streptomyces sp. XM4193]MCK1797345.1 DUF309 domain-containing protein [Streptomyces sp. XM4193]
MPARDQPKADRSSGRPARGGRDRDEEGRARNARPRDGLGRPLPYGSPGVERQPEGVVRAPLESVEEAQRLLDEGKPFHAHEVFEDAWKSGPPEEERLWRALAQLAVGVTHTARGNVTGARTLLRRAAAGLAPLSGQPPYGLDLGGLVAWAEQLASGLQDGQQPPSAASMAPRLRG